MTGTSKTGAIGWGAALIAVAAGVGFYLLVHQPTVRKTTDLEQSISEVRQREATARDRAGTLEQQLAALSRERDALRTERDGLAAETGRLSTTVQEREAELARMGAAQVSLESQLADEIRSGAIVVENVGGELKVKLNDEILFSSGETELTAQGQEVLRRLAQSLTSLEEGLIEVGGHTDSTPVSDRIRERFATNWELSATRATNVVRFLQDECNIPGSATRCRGLRAVPTGREQSLGHRTRTQSAHRVHASSASDSRSSRGGRGLERDDAGGSTAGSARGTGHGDTTGSDALSVHPCLASSSKHATTHPPRRLFG